MAQFVTHIQPTLIEASQGHIPHHYHQGNQHQSHLPHSSHFNHESHYMPESVRGQPPQPPHQHHHSKQQQQQHRHRKHVASNVSTVQGGNHHPLGVRFFIFLVYLLSVWCWLLYNKQQSLC